MKTKTPAEWLVSALVLIPLVVSACSSSKVWPLSPTATPTASPTPAPPTLTPTPTATPTPIPTPTPAPAVRVTTGDQALFNGDWDKALEEYQAAQSSSDPEIEAAALLGIGRVYYNTGDYSKGLKALRSLTDGYPKSKDAAAAYFFMGKIYDALDRFGEAADAYQNYLARKPGLIDSYVLELRGNSLFAAGNYSGALNDYQAAQNSPRVAQIQPLLVKMARTYAIVGDYNTALVMYNDIYQAGDDYTKAMIDVLKGQAYMAMGETEQAYTSYLDAVQNYPLSNDSYQALLTLVNAGYPVGELDRGLVDYFAGQYQVAIAAFDRYLSANPADPATAYYYKGLSLAALGNDYGAIDQWDVVIQNYPESSLWDNAWEQKAYYLWAYLDQYGEAAQTLIDFVSSSPANPRDSEFLFDAGRVQERAGHLLKAAQTWDRVAREFPASDYAYRSLFQSGICYYRQSDFANAQSAFQRLQGIAQTSEQRSEALFWIGKAQNAAKDPVGARGTWEQAAAADPTGYYSERARDLLLGRAAFTSPKMLDLAYDLSAERVEAEAWMHTTFNLAPDVDLSGLGPLSSDPRIRRGTELWQLGEYAQARDEFENLRTEQADDPANTFRLAGYFSSLGVYRSTIMAARQVLSLAGLDDAASLNAPAYFSHLRFGVYYSDLILPASQQYGLDPLLLFSVVRQESFFESFVDSPAGARGLMQLIPQTARGIVDQNGWPSNYSPEDLYRPLVSITFGANYLRDQRNFLDGDLYAALAAYNGGPGNASEWKKLAQGDPDLFLEVVRYDETHLYITKIYEMYNIYRRLYDRTP